ncbi:MAG TPA: acyl carrier protein [Vicinamibacterales bacterium]|jgi:acyl carrier protein
MNTTESQKLLVPEIRAFVLTNFLFGQDGDAFTDDDSFLATGIIDSTGVLELVGFLEKHYGIHIENDELVPANLDSVNKAANFVRRKLGE